MQEILAATKRAEERVKSQRDSLEKALLNELQSLKRSIKLEAESAERIYKADLAKHQKPRLWILILALLVGAVSFVSMMLSYQVSQNLKSASLLLQPNQLLIQTSKTEKGEIYYSLNHCQSMEMIAKTKEKVCVLTAN